MLIDYDPSQNNGNWQWIASTGFESQAYYRYMNPITDLKKYDKMCIYVKKYVTELKNYSNNEILNCHVKSLKNTTYPKPICNFQKSIKTYIMIVKKINNST